MRPFGKSMLLGGRTPKPGILTTLDPAILNAETALSFYNLRLSKVSGASVRSAFATRDATLVPTFAYWEVMNISGGAGVGLGFVDATRNPNAGLGDGLMSSTWSAAGAVAMMAVRQDLKKWWVGANGVWNTAGDPVTGSGGLAYGPSNIYPIVVVTNPGDTIEVNFGHFPFTYTPPAGSSAWG
ncbi:hypothetical protein [Phenylobacterium sp.]|uniref:hypothetical protein n=1 Tax=Phenylobacterium sp. TaxID=1871053 RepID=UPI00391A2003